MWKLPLMGSAPKAKAARSAAVLVIGMHRSGLTPLAHMCALLGAAAPAGLITDETKPQLLGQSAHLVELHEEMLAALDSAWDDWRPLDSRWRDGEAAAAFADRLRQAVQEEFGDAPIFALKDPRISRALPFWMAALAAANIRSAPIVIVRNPLEVALSLRAREGFSVEKSMLLWLRHNLDAEFETRHLPRNIVTYDALLEDWRSLAVQSAGRLQLAWPKAPADASAEIRAYLSHDLHHQRATKEELDVDPAAPAWVKAAYAALIRLCDEPKSGRAKRELDLIRFQFNESCKLFGDVAYADRTKARDAVRAMLAAEARAASADALRAELDRTLAQTRAREEALAALDAERQELHQATTAKDAQIKELSERLERLRPEHDAATSQLQAEVAVASEAADELEKRAEAAERHISELVDLVAELETREAQTQEQIAKAGAEAQGLREEARSLNARIAALESQLEQARAKAAEANALLDESRAAKEQLVAALQAGLATNARVCEELAAVKSALAEQQTIALDAESRARRARDELAAATARMDDLAAREAEAQSRAAAAREEAATAAAKAGALASLVDGAQARALAATDEALRANAEAAAAQRLAREAEAIAAAATQALGLERIAVQKLEKRLASWAGLAGAGFAKARAQVSSLTKRLAALAPPKSDL